MEKVKKFLSNARFKAECLATSCALSLASGGTPVKADGPAEVVKSAINVVVDMFPFVGAFFIVAGVFKLILAYRNDQPEAQAGAAKDIVIGAVFVVFKTFVWSKMEGVVFAG